MTDTCLIAIEEEIDWSLAQRIERQVYGLIASPTRPTVDIYINTLGGMVGPSEVIIHHLRLLSTSGFTVRTIAGKLVASAGTLIHQAGNIRLMEEDSELLIHRPCFCYSACCYACAAIQEHYCWLFMRSLYTGKSKLTAEQLDLKTAKNVDWFLPANDALRLGLTDQIISKRSH